MRHEYSLVESNKKLGTEINNAVTRALLGLLGILFVALKLTGFIDWSWWWVTLPFWGGLALIIGLIVIAIVLALLARGVRATNDAIYELKRKWKRRNHG